MLNQLKLRIVAPGANAETGDFATRCHSRRQVDIRRRAPEAAILLVNEDEDLGNVYLEAGTIEIDGSDAT